jgi:uncharacterized lipoprotein
MNAFLRNRAAGTLARRRPRAGAGCESLLSVSPSKRIDYKSVSSGPALELPPDLTTPKCDDRYQVAPPPAHREAPTRAPVRVLPTTPDAKIVRAGKKRSVVRATPSGRGDVREFWQESGFVLAVENPQIGLMETDFAGRAEVPGLRARRSARSATCSYDVQTGQVQDAHRRGAKPTR